MHLPGEDRTIRFDLIAGLLFSLVLLSLPLKASFPPVKIQFDSVGNAQQVPDNVVTDVVQDHTGYLWVATPAGLVRYDGYRFKLFTLDEKDAQSIGGNFVRDIYVHMDGTLWISAEPGGISIYHPDTERFTRLFSKQTLLDYPALTGVTKIVAGPDGQFWLATIRGIFRVNNQGEIKKHYLEQHGLQHKGVRALMMDAQGNLWAGTRLGLNIYNPQSDSFESILNTSLQGEFHGSYIRSLHQTSDGLIWIGTNNNGVWTLAADTRDLKQVLQGAPEANQGDPIYSILQVNEDEVWLARFSGIDRVDARSGRWLDRIYHDPSDPFSLANNDVRALLLDKAGIVWVAGYGGGLQHVLGNIGGVSTLRFSLLRKDSLSEPNVSSVLEMEDGQIWIGTRGAGVDIYNREKGMIGGHYPMPGEQGKLDAGWIATMTQVDEGDIWLGVNPGLLYRYQKQTKRFESYDGTKGFDGSNVRALQPSKKGGVWIGTNAGLRYWDHQTDQITTLYMADGSPMLDGINALHEAENGWLLAATGATGIYLLKPGQTGLSQMMGSNQNGRELRTMAVVGMLMDSKQRLWVDTPTGLHLVDNWDSQTASLTNVSQQAGFGGWPMGANMLEDKTGRIWTPSFVYDPEIRVMKPLQRADGIDIGTSWFRSFTKTRDGILMYGGSQGLLLIDPSHFEFWDYMPDIVPSELLIDGKPVNAGTLMTSGLTLTSEHKSFTIEFSSLDLSEPENNLYRYKLEGFDRDWINTDATRRSASYSNLWPGAYNLKVEATNRSGIWSERSLDIPIVVQARFWQSWWFLLLLAVVLSGVLYIAIGLRTRYIRKRTLLLEELVNERTQALKHAQQELIEQEKMASLGGLVAGVSHEINTPMGLAITAASGMNDFSNDIIAKVESKTLTRSDLAKYADNVKESNRIILNSLERARELVASFKQVAVDQTSEQRRCFNMKDFLQDVRHSTRSLYSRGSHRLVINCPANIEIDSFPGTLFQIISNLIQNSVIHGFDGMTSGVIEIQVKMDDDSVVLTYTDNGKGMSEDVLEKAFEPFFTTKRGSGGSGLGLHMVYNYVTQLLQGSIQLESQLEKGLHCEITLPHRKS